MSALVSAPHTPANAALSARTMPWRALVAATAAALLLHAALLGWLPLGLGPGLSGGVAPVLQTRQILQTAAAPSPQAAPQAAPPTAPPTVPPTARPRPRVAAAEASAPVASPDAPAEPAASPAEPLAPAAPQVAQAPEAAASDAVPLQAAAEAASAQGGGGQPIPTYATRRPPAVVMQFELKRAGITGSGELTWHPAENGYSLQMHGTAFALPIISWISQGRFDAHGLAPDRFVDRRRARDVRAANFQREQGRITYSGPSIEHPLVPGSQDRLSWMMQLSAVVAAEPAAFAPAARVAMFVAGARADADVWTFSVEAVEPVDVVEGRIAAAWRLVREPRKPYDTRVEVWLDPERHFLPVKMRLIQPNSGEGFEFNLQRMTFAP